MKTKCLAILNVMFINKHPITFKPELNFIIGFSPQEIHNHNVVTCFNKRCSVALGNVLPRFCIISDNAIAIPQAGRQGTKKRSLKNYID